MNCNLVKSVTSKEVDGKTKKYTNFYLLFDNGEIVPIQVKSYSTNFKDAKEKEKVEDINARNYTKLNCMATLYEKK